VRVAIQQMQQSVLAADRHDLSRLAADRVEKIGLTWLRSASCTSLEMNWRYHRELAGMHVERHRRVGVEIGAFARLAVEIRRRIADGQIEDAALGIQRERRPQAAAAVGARLGSFQLSAPGSPSSGIRLNRHTGSPVVNLNAPTQFFAPQSAPAGP
jgi:hypothetical protein